MRKKEKPQVVLFIKNTIIAILTKELIEKSHAILLNIIFLSLQMLR